MQPEPDAADAACYRLFEESESRRSLLLYPLLALLLVSVTGESLLMRKVAIAAKQYPYTLTQLTGAAGVVLYALICAGLIFQGRLNAEQRRLYLRSIHLSPAVPHLGKCP